VPGECRIASQRVSLALSGAFSGWRVIRELQTWIQRAGCRSLRLAHAARLASFPRWSSSGPAVVRAEWRMMLVGFRSR
jgi:hypothetical protein